MKKNLLIIVIAVLLLTGWTLQSKPTFEYKTEYLPTDGKLNQLGSDGWELVAIGAKGGGGTFNALAYVFKRAK